ncbi:DUF4097 family beta strand repeat-containing protein [Kitasatospora sp. NPDC048540]|uniref:DUF4097 family beta strand repeat-containing protein n=1 Tax=Kitasatospora sp. NPDC048540 TaxID=3155634 RepID=UPI00340E6E16
MKRALLYGVVTAAVVGGMSGCFLGEDEHRDVAYSVVEPVRVLVIEGNTGDIRVVGGAGGVQVTEHHTYRDGEPEATHAVADGTLTLGYHCPDDGCGVGYEVRVPAGTEVRVVNSTGGVRLAGLTAAVDAETSTGSIEAEALAGAHVRLSTDTGDVRAQFGADPTGVELRSDTGSVSVKVPGGEEYAVDAGTGTGSVHVSVPRRDAAPRTITAHTGTGDVTVARA